MRLELEGVALRLNLLGQPGEQPDYVVAAWVLPYVYALRGDRDWRRSPQLTGSRQVSPLAIQAYKRLESGDATVAELKQFLGREVSEAAVLRAITELWQQLRIVPVVSAPGQPAQWQLLRHRFQKAIAEGASTSQVTAISVLASIFLQAVIASSMEEVEMFLSPLTARSKIREVVRGLVATRQVHTLSMGHAPHFYVAGTLPEFSIAPTMYASSSMAGSGYLSYFHNREETVPEPVISRHRVEEQAPAAAAPAPQEIHSNGSAGVRKPSPAPKAPAARPHFSRPAAAQARDRKPSQSAGSARPTRRTSEARPATARPASGNGRAASSNRWSVNGAKPANGTRNGNGNHATAAGSKSARSNGNGHAAHPPNGARGAKPSAPAWGKRNGTRTAAPGKPASTARTGTMSRSSAAPRKDARPDARPVRGSRKPAVAAAASGSKRYDYASKQGTKKRG